MLPGGGLHLQQVGERSALFGGIAEVLSEVDRLGGVGHTQLGIAHVVFFSSLQPNNWKTVAELAEIR